MPTSIVPDMPGAPQSWRSPNFTERTNLSRIAGLIREGIALVIHTKKNGGDCLAFGVKFSYRFRQLVAEAE
ncbi:hypothetical protein P3T16_002283 [Paraburkholderia sp. GAS42]